MSSIKRALPILGAAAQQSGLPAAGSLWRSLQERLRGGPDQAAAAAEFPAGGTDADAPEAPLIRGEQEGGGTSRRGFMQLLGGSMALAGLNGCIRRPKEQALPYTRQPENVVPGNPLHYATMSALGGYATGLLVTAYEGRPTKIEGNPDHPESLGATGLWHQAALHSLYDPQRAGVVKYRGSPRSWKAFLQVQARRMADLKAAGRGSAVRFLMEPTASPTVAHLRQRIQGDLPGVRFQSWSGHELGNALEGAKLAFGQPLEQRLDLLGARVIASLDSNFLSSQPGTLRHMRAFAAGRVPASGTGELSRLYQIETTLSVTGATADHRLPLRPSEIEPFALALLAAVGQARGGQLARFAGHQVSLSATQRKFVDALAKDLVRGADQSVVIAGERQSPLVHAIAHAINAGLGSAHAKLGKPLLLDAETGPRALAALTAEMKKGQVDTLVITARNPSYGAPADIDFAGALSNVPNVIYLAPYEDETAEYVSWFIPVAHELESWGDGRAPDGTVTFQQPLLSPLFDGQTQLDVLAALLGEGERGPFNALRDYWQSKSPGSFEEKWQRWVSDGLIAHSATPEETASLRWDDLAAAAQKASAAGPPASQPGELEVDFTIDSKLYDGRFANNAWLQEMPDPITRSSWDNAALVSVATAARLGVTQDDVVLLNLRGRSVRAPILVQPGQADGTVTLPIGYGRARTGEVLSTGVGFNANLIRTADHFWSDRGLTLRRSPTGEHHEVVQTQEHHTMEGHAIAISMTRDEFRKEGKEVLDEHRGEQPTFHTPFPYDGFKWALAIDLGKCTGCNACVLACQSENNISVVGRENVSKSREMHWLRIDRYYKGDAANPEVVVQPMLCQQCESAPCEYVCPVNATVHDDEGLNVMVYNRCVGTRYCSNNCPYKVRRFNFFNYTERYSSVERMSQNPDVTVRARGVMEKCTYCVQRIERVRIDSRVGGKVIKDGDIVTACEQACPAQAIVFGSLHDPEWRVAKLHRDPRRYDVLHDLGTRPRTAYLARIKNPNPELA